MALEHRVAKVYVTERIHFRGGGPCGAPFRITHDMYDLVKVAFSVGYRGHRPWPWLLPPLPPLVFVIK